jgi:indolepyruvate ferredoxin oxidoreductase, beta subunit
MNRSILICGVGGQGTVLAAKLLAQAALGKGIKVRSAETIGMAQRGGSVTSHVRLGAGMWSPLIPAGCADTLIAFEPCEAVRNIFYLKNSGIIVLSSKVLQPVSASLTGKTFDATVMTEYLRTRASKVILLDTDALCSSLGSTKIVNTLLLGAAVTSGMLGVTMDDLKQAVRTVIKPELIEINIQALEKGESICK